MDSSNQNAPKGLILEYPGYVFNLLGIVAATVIVSLSIQAENTRVSNKIDSAKSYLSEYMESCTKVAGNDDSLRVEIDKLEMELAVLKYERPEDKNLNVTEYTDSHRQWDTVVGELTDETKFFAAAKSSEMREKYFKYAYEKVEVYWSTRSQYVNNGWIFVLWIALAAIYLIVVALSYKAGKFTTERSEPILNIIDVGLYLTLIEYSGGFDSPIRYVIGASAMVAALDLRRVYKAAIENREVSVSYGKWHYLTNAKARFLPALFYTFSLCTGLVWASLDTAIFAGFDITDYTISYFKCLGIVVLIGAAGAFLFNIITLMIAKEENKSAQTI